MSVNASNVPHLRSAILFALVLFSAGPFAQAAEGPSTPVAAYLAEARVVALTEHDVQLHLDTRDIKGVASILEQIRSRNLQAPLSKEALVAEVYRWGAVLGEIQRSQWTKAHWGRSKERNRAYSYSVYVPLEGGGWLESDEFDLVEGFITKPPTDLTIQQALWLHFLD